jgi:GNAT superfamily N-acetyltransferase
MPGDELTDAIHLGAYVGTELASACLVMPEPCPWLAELDQPVASQISITWRLRGMATEPRYRGTGAGTAILVLAAETAQASGADTLWCLAREPAIGFYERNGWLAHGLVFDTEIGPHLRMWRPLERVNP